VIPALHPGPDPSTTGRIVVPESGALPVDAGRCTAGVDVGVIGGWALGATVVAGSVGGGTVLVASGFEGRATAADVGFVAAFVCGLLPIEEAVAAAVPAPTRTRTPRSKSAAVVF